MPSISGIKVKARFQDLRLNFPFSITTFYFAVRITIYGVYFKKLYCLRINHILPFFPFHFISLLCSAKQEISGEVGKENARQSVLHTAGVLLRSHLQDKKVFTIPASGALLLIYLNQVSPQKMLLGKINCFTQV